MQYNSVILVTLNQYGVKQTIFVNQYASIIITFVLFYGYIVVLTLVWTAISVN